VRNIHNKNDMFTVESVNADLRYYIPILRRRSRCFPRSLDTLQAVLEVFADAYNAFGVAKMKFRHGRDPNARELPFSVLDYLRSMRLATATDSPSLRLELFYGILFQMTKTFTFPVLF